MSRLFLLHRFRIPVRFCESGRIILRLLNFNTIKSLHGGQHFFTISKERNKLPPPFIRNEKAGESRLDKGEVRSTNGFELPRDL